MWQEWRGLCLCFDCQMPPASQPATIHPPLLPALQALGALNNASQISKWIGVVVMLLAVCMNMSAVDSLQVCRQGGWAGRLGVLGSQSCRARPVGVLSCCPSAWLSSCIPRLPLPPQNGLTAGFSSHLLKGKPVSWTKLAVLVINVPLVVLGARPNGLDLKVLDVSDGTAGGSHALAPCLGVQGGCAASLPGRQGPRRAWWYR